MPLKATPRVKKSQQAVVATADRKQTNAQNRDAWASELSGRVHFYGKTIDQFIDTLLPCSTPYTLDGNLNDVFKAYKPGPGREIEQYPNLVSGLTTLVEPFPASKRLTFADTHHELINFPFDAFIVHHHSTAPDISVSFPGKPLGERSWQNLSLVVESKDVAIKDPFVRDARKHTGTIEQMAKNARNIMLAHGLLAAFVVGIYGNTVRLARFDHTCALVSSPFYLTTESGRRLLQKFLWHFTHPVVGNGIVGSDPTVKQLNKRDQNWIRDELQRAQVTHWQDHVKEIEKGRRVEVYDEKTGRCVPYLIYQPLDVNGRLFSRATMVWRAIEDTRIWKKGRLVRDPTRTTPIKPQIMKEAWRQLVRTAESKFYKRINRKIKPEERYGLATMVCGGDLGEFEARWWKETERRRKEASTSMRAADAPVNTVPSEAGSSNPDSSSRLFSSVGSTTTPLAASIEAPENYIPSADFPLPKPHHQTYSWRLVDKDKWHRERSHMRIIIDDVGRPLTDFDSTSELVRAIRDAIRGHQLAWQKASVLHRDISVGNILITDEIEEKRKFDGFLHDYDYSAMEPDDEDEPEPEPEPPVPSTEPGEENLTQTSIAPDDPTKYKERTGTYYFMAYEILDVPGIIHNTHHDLESFYWVLLWVVVRHTIHCHSKGDKLCSIIFTFGDDDASAAAKMKWLETGSFDIPRNKPLTYLLNELTRIVLRNIPRREVTRELLDYDPVLKVFDNAIAMTGWPTHDWQPCKLTINDGRTGIAEVVGAGKPPKEPGLVTAPEGGTTAASVRKQILLRLAAHSLDPHLLPNTPPKKRTCATVDEEDDELDSRGTAWMSESPDRTSNRRKRVRTNEGPSPVPRSQPRAAQEAHPTSMTYRRACAPRETFHATHLDLKWYGIEEQHNSPGSGAGHV
ncbi:hypothetical protein VTO73DRAFT_8815 [Trametes versicolor]